MVRTAVDKLGYRPRRRSSGTRHSPTQNKKALDVFALITPEVRGGLYASLQEGFEAGASTGHKQIITCSSNNDVDRQGSLILQLIDKQVAGVAIVPVTSAPTPPQQIRILQNAGIPVVLLHRDVEGISAPCIDLPYQKIGETAAQAMMEHGHTRVGAIFSTRHGASQAYCDAIADTYRDAGLSLSESNVAYTERWPLTVEDEERIIGDWLSSMMSLPHDQRPTAIFVPQDPFAESIFLQALEQGLNVPDDLSIVSFGGSWRGSAVARRIAAVTVDESPLGQQSAKLLNQMSNGEMSLTHDVHLQTELGWYEGQTLATITTG